MDGLPSVASERGWSALLELGFTSHDGRTVLERRGQRGPLQVQRAFYPEGPGTAHVYVLHPPGGVVGGDQLTVRAALDRSAHALLTTPAATKLYRSAGKLARSTTTLRIEPGATLEWLPGETLAFSGAHVELSTRVELAPGGVFVGWEVLGLGRPAAGERFLNGTLTQRFEIWRDQEPLLIERGRYRGAGAVLTERWGLGGAAVSGLLTAVPADQRALAAVRSSAAEADSSSLSATLLGQVLVVRVLSPSAAEARAGLETAWGAIRPEVVGLSACPPRVWKT